MSDNKNDRYIQQMTRVRNVSQAASLAAKRSQGKAPDTVLYSARIISIEPNKSALRSGNSSKGTKKKTHRYPNR